MQVALVTTVLTIIASINVATATKDVETAWLNFQSKYNKQHRSLVNVALRKSIFVDNYNKINEHNKLYEEGKVTYKLAINKFAAMSDDEFRNTYNSFKKATNLGQEETEEFVFDKCKQIPDTFDWTEKGAVTPVKSQGRCGSCWAFSATGALEGQQFLKTGKLVSISEQNLIDCTRKYHNGGCAGGEMNAAFQYVHDNDGIDSEDGYPYEAKTLECRYKSGANVTSTKGYARIESGNEEALRAAIATIGPIAVAIDASNSDFKSYESGVYYNLFCHNGSIDPLKELDHAVLAVGYGTEDNQDYWLIKNSWGEDWGDKGYIKMARNRNDNCGVASYASYPINY